MDSGQIVIDDTFLSHCGNNTLIGTIYRRYGRVPMTLLLIFPESSLAYCRRNGGPHETIIQTAT